MDPLDEKLKQRAKEEPFPLPEEFSQRLEALCRELEAQPARKKRVFHPLRWTAGAAAALILLLPNVSVSAQAAMEQIPVLGSIVRVVTPDLCGEKAGLQTGDIITKIGDTEVASSSELIAAKNTYSPGDTVTLTVYRSGETLTLDLTLEESTPEKEAQQEEAEQAYKEQQQQQLQQEQQQGSGGFSFGF